VLIFKADQSVSHSPLAIAVRERSAVAVEKCYQCGKCSAGCPVASFMDLTPRQIMRAIQLGQQDLALRSSTIWLCASCHTCSTRCPMEIDVAAVMDALRAIALAERAPVAEKSVLLAHRLFLESIKRLGRVYEVGVVAGMNIGTVQPMANMDLGLPMFARGKLSIVPARAGAESIRRLFARSR
jgi:heterodisulfide reductase subunit C2